MLFLDLATIRGALDAYELAQLTSTQALLLDTPVGTPLGKLASVGNDMLGFTFDREFVLGKRGPAFEHGSSSYITQSLGGHVFRSRYAQPVVRTYAGGVMLYFWEAPEPKTSLLGMLQHVQRTLSGLTPLPSGPIPVVPRFHVSRRLPVQWLHGVQLASKGRHVATVQEAVQEVKFGIMPCYTPQHQELRQEQCLPLGRRGLMVAAFAAEHFSFAAWVGPNDWTQFG